MAQVRAHRSEWTWEHRVKGKDGAWRTILSLGRPVRDDRDRITSWVGFNLDISDRKEAEDALRESEFACARCWTRARTRSC